MALGRSNALRRPTDDDSVADDERRIPADAVA
jgi:hypothetical protein